MSIRVLILKAFLILISHASLAQIPSDTIIQADFPRDVIILPLFDKFDKLPDSRGTYIFSGKKK